MVVFRELCGLVLRKRKSQFICITVTGLLLLWLYNVYCDRPKHYQPYIRPESHTQLTLSEVNSHIFAENEKKEIQKDLFDIQQADAHSQYNQRIHASTEQHLPGGRYTDSQQPNCHAKITNIAYIFNRKTGGTTLVTIFGRFSENKGYDLLRQKFLHRNPLYHGAVNTYYVNGENMEVLPTFGSNRRNSQHFLKADRTYSLSIKENQFSIKPRNIQTVYVSIVREPAAHFESIFNFFYLGRRINKTSEITLSEFFTKPAYYHSKLSGLVYERYAWNPQTYHLGLDHSYHDNNTIVEDYITHFEKEIDFVLVNEYYNHSLVLLRRMMCWDLKDIIYAARRVRNDQRRDILSTQVQNAIYKWNNADVKVYDYFNKTLWRKIRDYGNQFEADLHEFETVQNLVAHDCTTYFSLSYPTVKRLKEAGSIINDPVKFCQSLYSNKVFTTFVRISKWSNTSTCDVNNGPPQSSQYPLTASKHSIANYEQSRCIHINYLKNVHTPTPGLDVYFSINSTHTLHLTKFITSQTELNTLTTSYHLTTSNHLTTSYQLYDTYDMQVMCEAKLIGSGNAIQAVTVSNGIC